MNVLLGLLWLLAALAAIVLLPIGILFMLVVGLLGWACGVPLTIKESGKEIGHVRWFTFYRKETP